MKRHTLENTYGRRYKEVHGDTCIYCGALADVKDHVPALESAHLFSTHVWEFKIVPACTSCNFILGAKALPTIPLRAQWLLAELYARLMKAKHTNKIEKVKQLHTRIKYLEDNYD